MSSERFHDWRDRARDVDLVEAASRHGAQLKRHGREFTGPCPACGGRDRFSIHTAKNAWHCRGHGGGHDAIGMVMHIVGLSFLQACEDLTGEPNPSGREAKPISDAERASRNRKRLAAEEKRKQREADDAIYRENTREAAAAIWGETEPLKGTLGEEYLSGRGVAESHQHDALRYHHSLPYPGATRMPALVCRVDDVAGSLSAIWRIYLDREGSKADVENAKLGLGPAGGGAVRIGGIGPKIGIAEGVETALGAWHLAGKAFPVWAALSTSGMIGIELPLIVERVVIFPDGDTPLRRHGDGYEAAEPAGRKAALSLKERLTKEGIACSIAPEPAPGSDYLDLWLQHARDPA